MNEPTPEAITKRLFSEARSFGGWLPQALSRETLLQLHSLAQWGPTSMNSQPMRLKFAQSDSSRKKLSTCVDAGNVSKVLSAPVVAIIGMDLNFPETLTELFPHKAEAKNYYIGNAEKTFETALRNSAAEVIRNFITGEIRVPRTRRSHRATAASGPVANLHGLDLDLGDEPGRERPAA